MAKPPTLVNFRTGARYDVDITRPSIWSNRHRITASCNRDQALELFEKDLRCDPYLLGRLRELEGMVLGCGCKPKKCHGDVIIRFFCEYVK